MNELERFGRLAAQARQERPPAIDMVESVLGRIRATDAASGARRESIWLLAVSGLSAVAAAVMAAVAVGAWQTLTNPLGGMFQSVAMVLP